MSFLEEVEASDLEFVGTCNELNAAYAADGCVEDALSCFFKETNSSLPLSH